ncbi:MAG: hypothetical protein C0425_02575 [Chlorobiaceae bacterium]|nr:hypothetical protein [Chlorobiaceae bacterium]MBA4309206.1 hypothetical protein [Chlorobiaceae bacterium]
MKVSELVGHKIFIKDKLLKQCYELLKEKEVIAKVSIQKLSSYTALVEGGFGEWEIKPKNIFRNKIYVYKKDDDQIIAAYSKSKIRNYSLIDFQNGKTLSIRKNSFRREIIVSDSMENNLLEIKKLSLSHSEFSINVLLKNELLDKNPYVIFLALVILLD